MTAAAKLVALLVLAAFLARSRVEYAAFVLTLAGTSFRRWLGPDRAPAAPLVAIAISAASLAALAIHGFGRAGIAVAGLAGAFHALAAREPGRASPTTTRRDEIPIALVAAAAFGLVAWTWDGLATSGPLLAVTLTSAIEAWGRGSRRLPEDACRRAGTFGLLAAIAALHRGPDAGRPDETWVLVLACLPTLAACADAREEPAHA